MEDGIFFNQSKYIKEMLKKFVLEDSKPMKTLMSPDTRLTKDEECESVDNTKYRGIIGSLLFLTASRPDIMFSVCLCTRFQEAPKTSYFEVVKRIFRYIKGTTQLGLCYLKGTSMETVVYVDSDHAGDYVDRKSTSGICTFMGCCLTSWFSKKQTALAISTTEAEYVSAGKAGHRDHVSACLCHMLYCNESSTPHNLAFFILKRMEKTQNKPKELLPYGMLLSRLFKHVVFVFLELAIDNYPLFDHVLHPLAPYYERKTRANRGKKRPRESNASSSFSTLNHPPSSHPLDDSIDENDDESFYNTTKIQQRSGIPLGVLLHSPYAQVTENDLKRDVLQNVTFNILKSEYTQPVSDSPFRPPFTNRNELVDHPIGDDKNTTNPPPVPPISQAPHTLSTINLHILKKGEYDIWAMKIEHYLGHKDYPILEVIQKGNGLVQVSTDTNGQIRVFPPKTAEEILAKERERKARTTLLMAIPEDHLAKFHKITNAKEIWEAIKSRLGVSTEDANQKFLRVLDYDVKGSTASSSITQNVAFVFSDNTNNTNEVSTAYGVSTSFGHNLQKEGSSSYTDDLIEYISKGNQESRKRDVGNTKYKARHNGRRHAKQDEHKAMVTINREGVDWTSHAKDDTENYALMAFNSSNSGSNTEMSAKDKFRLGYRNQIHEGALSYENEVFESVFDNRSSDVEDSPMNDRFAKVKGMHEVPPPMTGIYMPPKSDFRIDESKFTYETLESMPKLVESKPKAVSEPKVWSDAPIIEENKLDSDDEYVFKAPVEQEKPRYGYTKMACFVCGSFSHLIRDCDFHEKRVAKQVELNKSKNKVTYQRNDRPVWNNMQRLNHQNKFVPTAILTKTDRFLVNAARQNFSRQAASTSTIRKVNTTKPIVNEIRSRNNVYKSHSPTRRPFNRPPAPKAKFANHKITTAGDKMVSAVGGNTETAVKASAEYQEFNGGPVVFGGSKGQITGKGFFSHDTKCLVLSPDFKLPDANQVLLRVPRQNNMYSFNLENILPSKDLACLIAKATVDESNKWHMRTTTPMLLVIKESNTRPSVRPN
nr:uncharacterized mitochondrial protein AtMg00810-like [Tanacetum cinerariifolium]